MKTPYDTAMRVQRREVDAMGVAINVQVGLLAQVETAQKQVHATINHEADVAGSDLLMSSHAFMTRMRAERRRLSVDSAARNAELDGLRAQAAAAYGAFRTIEVAAEGYRADENRRLANVEQASVDDSSANAFLKASRAARKGHRR